MANNVISNGRIQQGNTAQRTRSDKNKRGILCDLN